MGLIIVGLFGFVLLLFSDICGIRKHCVGTTLFAFLGIALIFSSSIYLLMFGETFNVSTSLRITSGILTIIFLGLLIYSVLIEVNLHKKKEDKLITFGTYALTRHPGVLWLLFYYIFGALLFANIELLIAGIIWSIANVFYVYLQEKFIFNKIFIDYDLYAITTPMLLPNIKSAKRCIKTLAGGQNEKLTRNV